MWKTFPVDRELDTGKRREFCSHKEGNSHIKTAFPLKGLGEYIKVGDENWNQL